MWHRGARRAASVVGVTHPFLSDEWIAAAEEIRDRHAGQGVAPPVQVRMNVVVTDVPFGDGTELVCVDTSQGAITFERGELDKPDVTVKTDYTTAKSLFVDQDPAVAMQAFMGGRIKVQGDMTKLLVLQAGPPDDTARSIAAEIKAVTT